MTHIALGVLATFYAATVAALAFSFQRRATVAISINVVDEMTPALAPIISRLSILSEKASNDNHS